MSIAPTSNLGRVTPARDAMAANGGGDLAALIRSASLRGDDKLLAKLAELMINQSALRIAGSGDVAPASQSEGQKIGNVAGARARVYGATPSAAAATEDLGDGPTRAGDADILTPKIADAGQGQRNYRQKLDDIVVRAAKRHGVDPNLARAVVTAESDFNPKSLSSAGAMGLMQLMPGTARDLGVNDPWDPEQNVDGGVRYLGQMLSRFDGDVGKALMAYNWGPSNVERQGRPPAETRNYLEKVTRLRQLYAEGFSAMA